MAELTTALDSDFRRAWNTAGESKFIGYLPPLDGPASKDGAGASASDLSPLPLTTEQENRVIRDMSSHTLPKTLTREFNLERVKSDDRTAELSFSSEYPCERAFGMEILDHSPGACDLSRLNSGAALLLEHDRAKQVGVVTEARIEGRKGRATVKFSKGQLGEEIWTDVKEGIRKLVSVSYEILKGKAMEGGKYLVTRWRPLEISIVSVPFDPSVGVGRSHSEIKVMSDENTDNFDRLNQLRSNECNPSQEKHRRLEIEALGKVVRDQIPQDFVQRAIMSGMSVEEFRSQALAQIKPTPIITPYCGTLGMTTGDDNSFIRTNPIIGMDGRQRGAYSFTKAILEAAEGKLSGVEKEVNDEFTHRCGKRAQGFWVPGDMMVHRSHNARAMTAGTLTAGGFLVNSDSAGQSMIELLRNQMVTVKLGARTLSGLQGNVGIPRQTSAGTPYWLDETSEVTTGDQGIGQLSLVPHAVSCNTVYSKELLIQASPDIETFIRTDLVTVIALERDRVYLRGSGSSGEPLGILNTTGVNSVTFGAAATWAKVLDFELALAEDNVAFVRPGWVFTPAARAKLKNKERFSSTGITVWSDNNTVSGYPAEVTNQILSSGSGTLNQCILADWNDFIIAEWGAIDVAVDPYSEAKKRKVGITISEWVDCGIRHAASACISSDSAAQ